MDKNIENEIKNLSSIIKEKINEQLEIMSQRGETNDKNNLAKILGILNELDNLVNTFSNEINNFSVLLDKIKSLPALDSKSAANKDIIDAFFKDLHHYREEFLKEINNKNIEINALSKHIYVNYHGQDESNTHLRTTHPETVYELINTTMEKLFALYYKKAMNNERLRVTPEDLKPSTKVNPYEYKTMHNEIGTINEYERMYHENKIEIQPKRKMFFIKQEPSVVIAKAKKLAVEKTHATAILDKLDGLPIHNLNLLTMYQAAIFPSMQLGAIGSRKAYLYDRFIYSNTISAVKKISKKYEKIFFDAESKLYGLDFDKIVLQVSNVHREEEQEANQNLRVNEKQYHESIKQAVVLGYELAQARANNDNELYARLLEQEYLLNLPREVLISYENEGFRDFKNKQFACEIFKIDEEKYNSLSYETRQNILSYVIPAMTKNQEEIQYDNNYIELQNQINNELANLGMPSEPASSGRHM